jgi:hypothetical protein
MWYEIQATGSHLNFIHLNASVISDNNGTDAQLFDVELL